MPNGFDGVWNPNCPGCGGYLYAGCTCPKPHLERIARVIAGSLSSELPGVEPADTTTPSPAPGRPGGDNQ